MNNKQPIMGIIFDSFIFNLPNIIGYFLFFFEFLFIYLVEQSFANDHGNTHITIFIKILIFIASMVRNCSIGYENDLQECKKLLKHCSQVTSSNLSLETSCVANNFSNMKSFQNKIKNELTNQFNESMDQFNTKNQLMITPLWEKNLLPKLYLKLKNTMFQLNIFVS
ncbi:hypothetical protein DERF_006009 [Dermatophagoides farinae]|uniref:Uncharacterized protein n=1 Tax=Dermatophagoides farinae TaxID=6954 RepID=A0A922I6R4_DERFA|nr:hypothetical protein DERF_006009 [Dermatophagoides farinae]